MLARQVHPQRAQEAPVTLQTLSSDGGPRSSDAYGSRS